MPEDFTDALHDLSGSSDDDSNLHGDGADEVQGSCAEGQVCGPGNDPGDEQQARRVMLNPAPDANAQELRKVHLSFFVIILGHHHT
jgi:hypothetical protein